MHLRRAACVIGMLSLASCSFIEVRPGADNIRVLNALQVGNCETVGEIQTSALDHLGIFNRDPGKVYADQVQLARNHAVDMKGDTIVPGEQTRPGERRFSVYRCMK